MTLQSSSLTQARLIRATKELATQDRHLGAMVRANGIPPLWGRPPGYATLIRIILEQQVSLASGAAAYRRLSQGVGRVTPGNVLAHSHSKIMRMGQTRQKARYVRELATAIVEGDLDLRSLIDAPSEEVRERLMRIPGIGRWTADIYLLNAHKHPDIWPRGDLALYAVMRKKMNGTDRSAGRLDAMAHRWKPWRSVAARILWHSYLCDRRAT